jgi:ribonuclease BN (tRNA processing enzyme)
MSFSNQVRRGAVTLGCLWLLALVACSKKEPIVGPEPVPPGQVRVQGNRILWSTDRDSRASVRYSTTRGLWDHMAYPDAAGRGDRAFTTGEHTVALLDTRPGQLTYFQAVSESPDAAIAYSAPDSFQASTGPATNLLVSTMINIGFGDSHLLRMPTTGKRFVIDCGGRDAEAAVETYYAAHGVSSIDAMLATHIHTDHLGGVVGFSSPGDGVLTTYPPAVFFDSPVKSSISETANAYEELLRDMPAATSRVLLHRGDSNANIPALRLDPEVQILTLNSGRRPGVITETYEGTLINNESIVLKFTYGDVDFIIGGDAEQECEGSMIGDFAPATLEVEFYKCQHHGLNDANSSSWINTLKPRVAFIPNSTRVFTPLASFYSRVQPTLDKLAGIRADVYVIDDITPLGRSRNNNSPQTSPQYNISFVTDGRSYEIRAEVATQPAPLKPASSYACMQGSPSGSEVSADH